MTADIIRLKRAQPKRPQSVKTAAHRSVDDACASVGTPVAFVVVIFGDDGNWSIRDGANGMMQVDVLCRTCKIMDRYADDCLVDR